MPDARCSTTEACSSKGIFRLERTLGGRLRPFSAAVVGGLPAISWEIALAGSPEVSGTGQSWSSALAEMVRIVPALPWLVLIIILVVWLHNPISEFARAIAWRVRVGGSLHIGGFQLDKLNVEVTRTGPSPGSQARTVDDPKQEFPKERKRVLEECRGIFLAHRITPSREPHELYDVLIYVVAYDPADPALTPYPRQSLTSVKHVEYFFGPGWGSNVYKSEDRAHGFPIRLSAWAKFICNARLTFLGDDRTAMISRVIDFEMGAIGNVGPKTEQ